MNTTNSPTSFLQSADELDDLIPAWLDIIKVINTQKEDFSETSRGEGAALSLLAQFPEGLSSGELSENLALTTGRMANILHQLEDKGFIEREVLPCNRRKTRITLTASGEDHVNQVLASTKKRAAEVLRRLGRKDTEELIRIFKKLTDNEYEHAAHLKRKAVDE